MSIPPARGRWRGGVGEPGSTSLPPTYTTASPPPLAPGMTLTVPAMNAAHRHKPRIVRLH